ncbi:MAG: hypothetical protein IPH31_24120 [Lewinellaceae bacterium]|nr:hypothetical protein [Lewinellaceae bacterium]
MKSNSTSNYVLFAPIRISDLSGGNILKKNSWAFKILLLTLLAFTRFAAHGQMLSGNAFLMGNHVEVAVAPCGAFASTVAPPAGYHPRGGGGRLGFVADPAQDGFGVGTP